MSLQTFFTDIGLVNYRTNTVDVRPFVCCEIKDTIQSPSNMREFYRNIVPNQRGFLSLLSRRTCDIIKITLNDGTVNIKSLMWVELIMVVLRSSKS
jgi:hypothetical protein